MKARSTIVAATLAATLMSLAGAAEAKIFKSGPDRNGLDYTAGVPHRCTDSRIEIFPGNGQAIVIPYRSIGRNGEVAVPREYFQDESDYRRFGQLSDRFVSAERAGTVPFIGQAGMDRVEEYAQSHVPASSQDLYDPRVQEVINICTGQDYNTFGPRRGDPRQQSPWDNRR